VYFIPVINNKGYLSNCRFVSFLSQSGFDYLPVNTLPNEVFIQTDPAGLVRRGIVKIKTLHFTGHFEKQLNHISEAVFAWQVIN